MSNPRKKTEHLKHELRNVKSAFSIRHSLHEIKSVCVYEREKGRCTDVVNVIKKSV